MNPRHWTAARLALFLLTWPLASLAVLLFLGIGVMRAGGPDGGLVGVSLSALGPGAAVVIGPPLVVLAVWLSARARRPPPAG